jgi:hypothetical protein
MAGTAGVWRTGKGMRVSIDGDILNVIGFSPTLRGEDHDTTNSESEAPEGTVGWVDIEIKLEMNWDASLNPMDDPPFIVPGAILNNVVGFINKIDNTFFELLQARVIDAEIPIRIRDLIKYNVTMRGHGVWNNPTGSVAE